jgi:hypothetical protein
MERARIFARRVDPRLAYLKEVASVVGSGPAARAARPQPRKPVTTARSTQISIAKTVAAGAPVSRMGNTARFYQ